jgi:Aspartyl protease
VVLIVASLAAPAARPARAQAEQLTLENLIAARKAAIQKLHVHAPRTLELRGSILGVGLEGSFQSWVAPNSERLDQWVGARYQSMVRLGDRQYALDENGNVRILQGLMQERQRTDDFIGSDGFVSQPQYDRYLGRIDLPNNRSAYAIEVTPPGGLTETIALDTRTFMIDRISYDDDDGISTSDYYDYKVFSGALVSLRQVDSNGDHLYDLQRFTEHVAVNHHIDPALFSVPSNTQIRTDAPVTVPLQEHERHYFTRVRIHGREYNFLVDTGAQAIVLDARVASDLGLRPQGHLEVSGTRRMGGMGIAPLEGGLQIGAATLPVRMVTILDLRNVTGAFQADGVLGYPFFASAEVKFDAAAHSMTFSKPGGLRPGGEAFAVDVDRQLIELHGKVNGVEGRFVIDTGNSGELLLFSPFMKTHPDLVPGGERRFANSYGVGGQAQALFAVVDELDLGSYRFFNRYSNVMLSQQGAFADRFDAGNIGMGVLRNLIVTFDIANAKVYATQSAAYDDGRFRTRTETLTIPY